MNGIHMYPTRPDVEEFYELSDKYADLKHEADTLEYEIKLLEAEYTKEAVELKKKTKEIEAAKYTGNNDEQKEAMKTKRKELLIKRHESKRMYNKIEKWRAYKDLYISDNYAQRNVNLSKITASER